MWLLYCSVRHHSMLKAFARRVRHLRRGTAGQDLIEYAVLIALIATTVLFGMRGLGVKVPGFYEDTVAALPGEEEPAGGDPAANPGKGNPGRGNPGNDKPVGNAGPDPGNGNPAGGNGK